MPTHDSDMKRVNAEIERAQKPTEYLNPTGRQSAEWSSRDLCLWCGSEVTAEGCYCRFCDSCSQYWRDSKRKDFNDGRPLMQVCPECRKDGEV